jgi:hypothetical protein
VLLETSGNQAYIFASNRLRQNVGASELVHRATAQWVLEVVGERTGRALWSESTAERVRRLENPELNPRVGEGCPVEVVIATSARAVLLVDTVATGRDVVARVTERGLRLAPGLGVAGVVVPCPDRFWLSDALGNAARLLARIRSDLPSPDSRFRRLPIMAACATTGLPASKHARPLGDEEPENLSHVARQKLDAAQLSSRRMKAEGLHRLANSMDQLQSPDIQWLAVIHADGNGLGQRFRGFAEEVPAGGDPAKALRRLSAGVELAALTAFRTALDAAAPGEEAVAVAPLVLGGDDLTVVCDGRLALAFTTAYLRAFERAAAPLTASAGIAVVKHHYPLHAAYELADHLTGSAKTAKRHGLSALDFHVLLDSSGSDLDQIREQRRSREAPDRQVALWGGPYVVADQDSSGWPGAHSFTRLREAMIQLTLPGPDERRSFPSAAAHSLRSALFQSRAAADQELVRLAPRLTEAQLQALRGLGDGSLSVVRNELEPRRGRPSLATAFVDAMDAADLWGAP